MKLFDRIEKHSDLMHRMAQTVGADFGDAILSGQLTGHELRTAVLRCTCCDGADDCPGWMDAHPEGAAHAPGYCQNAELLDRLKP